MRKHNLQEIPIVITTPSAVMIKRVGGSRFAAVEHRTPSYNYGRGSRRTRSETNIRGVGRFSHEPPAVQVTAHVMRGQLDDTPDAHLPAAPALTPSTPSTPPPFETVGVGARLSVLRLSQTGQASAKPVRLVRSG